MTDAWEADSDRLSASRTLPRSAQPQNKNSPMILIDGSHGEGGGQIVRSSIALSMVTGVPVRISNVRASRRKPGLLRQHLTAVQAAQQISGANVCGANLGSREVEFSPGAITPGDYEFAVGTAGSTTLVLQAVLPALLTAAGPSRLTLEGGTHNPMAPPFDFLALAYLPLVSKMGPKLTARLERYGFYPAGGGKFVIDIQPTDRLRSFELLERGEIRTRRARAAVANLPTHIAHREAKQLRRKLSWGVDDVEILEVENSQGPGNVITIEIEAANVTEVFTGFGEVGRPAEAVAAAAVRQYRRYLKTTAAAGEYLTDQLLLPLAIAGAGSFSSVGLSRHSTTHIDLIRQFLDVDVRTEAIDGATILHVG